MEKPKTIYDFYGFPRPLYQVQYPASGSPGLARRVQELVQKTRVGLDDDWGLDHGTWSVLSRMFPGADVPVIQLSLDYGIEPAAHYELGRELMPLRKEGVLILGSGNIVHNLGLARSEDQAYDWAIEFDERIAQLIRWATMRPLSITRSGASSPAWRYQPMSITCPCCISLH